MKKLKTQKTKHKIPNTNNGITLIALVVTIIVMLILVAVTITMAINGGLFEKAGEAVSDTQNAIDKEQTLAEGKVQIDETWYDSIDDYLEGVESVTSLQEKHEFKYYSSLKKAIIDVNNKTEDNADSTKENAVAGVYKENEEYFVVLLKDIKESARVEPKVDMTINLGGHVFSTEDVVCIDIFSGNITIDGRIKGSIVLNEKVDATTIRAIQTRNDSKVNINGGTYITNSQNTDNLCIATYNSSNLTITDATIIAKETKSTARGIQISSGTSAEILNCNIKAYANTGVQYVSFGVISSGSLDIDNSYVMGTRSAVQINGGIFNINGGIYEGFEYGGLLFYGTQIISYIKNATIRECAIPEGYNSTITSKNIGFYIGGSSATKNIQVYVDSCDIYGSVNPFVLDNVLMERNNTVYISNSRINTEKKIKIGNNTHKLYIGKGCNFTAEHTTLPEVVTLTEKNYIKEN